MMKQAKKVRIISEANQSASGVTSRYIRSTVNSGPSSTTSSPGSTTFRTRWSPSRSATRSSRRCGHE